MKRSLLIGFTLLFTLILSACGSENAKTIPVSDSNSELESSEVKTIDLAHSLSDADTTPHHAFAKFFKQHVEELSNGSITVNIHANGVLGAEREIVEGTELGTIDAAVSSTAPLGNFSELAQILEFPYLFNDGDHVFKVLESEVGQEINKSIERDGILKVLGWFEVGEGGYSNSVHPILSPDDLKGLKLRTVESVIKQEQEEAFGAIPTPMAFTEVFTALQQGVVDGQGIPITTTVPNKFHEVQDYYSVTGHYYQTGLLVINPAVFNSFSTEEQSIIEEAAKLATKDQRAWLKGVAEQLYKEAEEAGVEVLYKDQLDIDAFKKVIDEQIKPKYEDQYGEYFIKIEELSE